MKERKWKLSRQQILNILFWDQIIEHYWDWIQVARSFNNSLLTRHNFNDLIYFRLSFILKIFFLAFFFSIINRISYGIFLWKKMAMNLSREWEKVRHVAFMLAWKCLIQEGFSQWKRAQEKWSAWLGMLIEKWAIWMGTMSRQLSNTANDSSGEVFFSIFNDEVMSNERVIKQSITNMVIVGRGGGDKFQTWSMTK